MPSPDPCPRCNADRLTVIYYDAGGQPLGGHSQCTECGPRHAEPVSAPAELAKELLQKKAS